MAFLLTDSVGTEKEKDEVIQKESAFVSVFPLCPSACSRSGRKGDSDMTSSVASMSEPAGVSGRNKSRRARNATIGPHASSCQLDWACVEP